MTTPQDNDRRRRPRGLQPSPSMYDERGYYNLFGGFHRKRDRTVYWNLTKIVAKRPWDHRFWRLAAHYAWRTWVHRSCDTTDFHHDIYCLLDPWVRKRDAEDRYVRFWKGHWDPKPDPLVWQGMCSDVAHRKECPSLSRYAPVSWTRSFALADAQHGLALRPCKRCRPDLDPEAEPSSTDLERASSRQKMTDA